ncbi:cytochrome c [Myxococcota bacterium]|nr:cytochrome c [Myxococcota bacterium]
MVQTLENAIRTAAAIALVFLFAGTSSAAGDAAAGKVKYDMFCASCHGPTGKGDGPVAAAIQPPPRDFSVGEFKFDTNGSGTAGTDEDLANVITNGGAKYGGNPMMAPWGGALSPTDIQNVVAYIRSLKQ